MECNIGKTDKTIRIVLGLIIIALGIVFRSCWGLVGLLPLVTALIGWCPAYTPFKISTVKVEKEK